MMGKGKKKITFRGDSFSFPFFRAAVCIFSRSGSLFFEAFCLPEILSCFSLVVGVLDEHRE